jgi:hypothetical protein
MRKPRVGRSLAELQRDYARVLRQAEDAGLDDEQLERLRAYEQFCLREGHRIGPFPGHCGD